MRRALVAVACAALLVALVAANRLIPAYERTVRPLGTTGTTGQRVHTNAFDITVDRVTVGRSLADKDGLGDKPEHTPGVFVLVWADLTGVDRPVTLDTAYLRTADGRRYDTTDAMGFGALNEVGTEAGLTRYGPIAFELPPDRLAGARLVVAPDGGENRLGAQADVDLRLSAAAARRLVAQAPAVVRYDGSVYR